MLGRSLPRNENKNSSRHAAVSVDIIGKAELKTVIRRFLEDYDGPRMVSGFPRYLTFLPLFFTLTASSSVLSLFVISPLSLSLYPLVPPTGIIKNKPGLSEASVFVEKKEGKYEPRIHLLIIVSIWKEKSTISYIYCCTVSHHRISASRYWVTRLK